MAYLSHLLNGDLVNLISAGYATLLQPARTPDSVIPLKEAFDLGRWFFVAFGNGEQAQCPAYQEPPSGGAEGESKAKLKEQKKSVLEKLAAQEAQLEQLLTELEETRAKAQTSERQLADLAASTTKAKQTADVFQFDEATTRKRLIDSQLTDAGWAVGINGTNIEQVGQEIEVGYQPTQTGKGYIDYVLWDDNGKPQGNCIKPRLANRAVFAYRCRPSPPLGGSS